MSNAELAGSTKGMMLVVALLFDSLQFWIGMTPVIGAVIGFILGPIISLIALIIFYLWFHSNGINIFSSRYAGWTVGATALEVTPFGILPTWTLWTAQNILKSKNAQS